MASCSEEGPHADEAQTAEPQTLEAQAPEPQTPEAQTLEAQVIGMLAQNEHEQALELLADTNEDHPGIEELRVQAHLDYANYLTHEADHLAMGARMATALRHYRRVAELDPENSQALTHIELIEGIYQQMGRDIPEGVAE